MGKLRAHLALISRFHATISRSNCQQIDSDEIVLSFSFSLSFWCRSILYHNWKNSREAEQRFLCCSFLSRSRKDALIGFFLSCKIKSILQGQLISCNRIVLITVFSDVKSVTSLLGQCPAEGISDRTLRHEAAIHSLVRFHSNDVGQRKDVTRNSVCQRSHKSTGRVAQFVMRPSSRHAIKR